MCMKFFVTHQFTGKWLKLYQTIKNLTSGESTGHNNLIQKTRVVVYLLDLFEGKGEKGQCDLACAERLQMIGLMVVMLSYSRVVSLVLVPWGVGLILRNGYGIQGKEVCCIASGKRNVNRVTLQEFNIRYKLLQGSHCYCKSVTQCLARQSLIDED